MAEPEPEPGPGPGPGPVWISHWTRTRTKTRKTSNKILPIVLLQPDPEVPRRLCLDPLPRRQALACTPDELIEQGFAKEWGRES